MQDLDWQHATDQCWSGLAEETSAGGKSSMLIV
jgi:hypothetical protein